MTSPSLIKVLVPPYYQDPTLPDNQLFHSLNLLHASEREMRPLNWYWFYEDLVIRNILGFNRRRYDPRTAAFMRDGRNVTFCHLGDCSTVLPTLSFADD